MKRGKDAVQQAQVEPRGLRCPKCGCGHFRVIYTRPKLDGKVMRRRECQHCGRRVTTTERVSG